MREILTPSSNYKALLGEKSKDFEAVLVAEDGPVWIEKEWNNPSMLGKGINSEGSQS